MSKSPWIRIGVLVAAFTLLAAATAYAGSAYYSFQVAGQAMSASMTVPAGGSFSASCTRLSGSSVTYSVVDAYNGAVLSAPRIITPSSGTVKLWANAPYKTRAVRVVMKSAGSAVAGYWTY